MNIHHLITDLNTGGAQMMLVKLLERMDRNTFAPRVFTLGRDRAEPLRSRLRAAQIPVTALEVSGYASGAVALGRLATAWRNDPPDLLQTWLHHADFVGLLAARLCGHRVPVVWNLLQSNLDPAFNRRSSLAVMRLCAALSRRGPQAILANSASACRAHADAGYDDSKFRIIPNGFDTTLFRPDPQARVAFRRELGMSDDALLFSWVGRFDIQKNPAGFIRAAGRWRDCPLDARFLLCGERIEPDNTALADAIEAAGHRECFFLLGRRTDVHRIFAASDVAVSSSMGESSPNVLGEALACGLPCVATDVGDVRALVGPSGLVVPAGDDAALSEALARVAGWTPAARRGLGEEGRRRVIADYSLGAVAATTEDFYRSLVYA